jgi:hypothetical protein
MRLLSSYCTSCRASAGVASLALSPACFYRVLARAFGGILLSRLLRCRSWTTLDFAASNSASSSLLGGHYWSQMRCGGLGSETCPYDCDAFGLHTSHDA